MNPKNDVIIRSPKTESDFQRYYRLRWEILRKPWRQPEGSEKVPDEAEYYHVMAEKDGEICGVGCIKLITEDTAQVRFMGVSPLNEKQRIGRAILAALENHAVENHRTGIKLFAREIAIPFYLKCGYAIIGDGYTLFDTIRHKLMEKKV